MVLSPKRISIFFLLRCFSLLVVASWYVPDEYFQSQEIAYKYVFQKGFTSWEYDPKVALRGFSYPFLYVAFYKFIQYFQLYGISVRFYGPRILQCLFSAISDEYLYSLSHRWFGPKSAFYVSLFWMTNWFSLYTMNRTLVNAMETSCTIIFFYYLLPYSALFTVSHPTEPIKNSKAKSFSSKNKSFKGFNPFFPLGSGIAIIAGVCFRPTILVPIFPAVLFMTFSIKNRFLQKVSYLLQSGIYVLLGIATSAIIDFFYYQKWTIILFNFVKFNLASLIGETGADFYGTQPWHWYISQGFPAIGNLYIGLGMYALFVFRNKKHAQCVLFSIIFTILFYSLIGHKEFRFILPLVPLVCIFAGLGFVHGQKFWPKSLLAFSSVTILLNLIIVFYLGQIHNIGPVSTAYSLDKIIDLNFEHESTKPIYAWQKESENHFVVHFLMPCHSTPLYSLLDKPHYRNHFNSSRNFHVILRFLDCTPRKHSSSRHYFPESDRFDHSPFDFVRKHYSGDRDSPFDQDGSVSSYDFKDSWYSNTPNIIVIYDNMVEKLSRFLTEAGYKRVDTIFNTHFPTEDTRSGSIIIFRKFKQSQVYLNGKAMWTIN